MTATVAEVTEVSVEDDDARRPLMTFGNIAWMNLGSSAFSTARYDSDGGEPAVPSAGG